MTKTRVRLANVSQFPRRRWTDVAVHLARPDDDGDVVFESDAGVRMPAVVSSYAGEHSDIVSIWASLNGGETLDGVLRARTDDDPPAPKVFEAHPWFTDNLDEQFPAVRLHPVGGGSPTQLNLVPAGMEARGLSQRWELSARKDGWHVRCWLTLSHMDPVADIELVIAWSDRDDPEYDNRKVAWVELWTGEPVVIDHRDANATYGESVQMADTRWATMLCNFSSQQGFIDGSSLWFTGQMLCTPEELSQVPWGDPDINNLIAALDGRTAGVSLDWDGNWLGNRYTPKHAPAGEARARWDKFVATTSGYRGIYAVREDTCLPTPGGTGDQGDFGATQCWEAVACGDPRAIIRYSYSVQGEFARGGLLLRKDGTLFNKDNTPGLLTWEGVPHDQGGSDLLGKRKEKWGDRRATGWKMHDDQHCSRNYLCGYYALTGSPGVRWLLEGIAASDSAMHRNRVGATRAGRLFGWWGAAMRLLEGEAHDQVVARVAEKAQVLHRSCDGAKHAPPVGEADGVYVIAYGNPDGRKPVHDFEGNLAPWWSTWEHGLWLVGAKATLEAMGDDVLVGPDERLRAVFSRVAHTMTWHAVFWSEAHRRWILPDDIWYPREEDPANGVKRAHRLPARCYAVGSPHMNQANTSLGGTKTWAVAGLVAALDFLLEEEGPTSPTYARLHAILDSWGVLGEPSSPPQVDWRTACWRATTQDIDAFPQPEPAVSPEP